MILPGLVQQHHNARYDPVLIKAIARGRAWFEELASGRTRSLQELASRDGISRRGSSGGAVPGSACLFSELICTLPPLGIACEPFFKKRSAPDQV
jgi:hypothetical protein